MITNICLLLEALSVILCIHYLYGEKFKLDIVTVSYLAANMIIMTTINYYGLPKICTIVIYPIIVLYCGIKFGLNIRTIIVNNILYMVIIGSIQLVVSLLYYFIFKIPYLEDIRLLIVNSISFVIVLFILSKCKLDKVSIYLQDKERIYIIALGVSIIVAGYCLTQYKKVDSVGMLQSILLFVSILFIYFLVFQLGNYKVHSKEVETELKMHKLYEDSFKNLIENIRMRQHEFNNHIHTIDSMCYMYDTYEDLVNAQKEYCELVLEENRYNKLLTDGNPVIICFLSGKFMEAEKAGIKVSYEVKIKEFDLGVPIYKIVEILGNLINNAIDALRGSEDEKRLFVSVIEVDDIFEIVVRNRSRWITYAEMDQFFVKGYSKKGSGRGLGLYNVKRICEEYGLDVVNDNKTIENENWFTFKITNKKETG